MLDILSYQTVENGQKTFVEKFAHFQEIFYILQKLKFDCTLPISTFAFALSLLMFYLCFPFWSFLSGRLSQIVAQLLTKIFKWGSATPAQFGLVITNIIKTD